jgi:hypothetical protein
MNELSPSVHDLLFEYLADSLELNHRISKLVEILKSKVGGASSNFMDLVERESWQDKD